MGPGRPKKEGALSGAERNKKYREKMSQAKKEEIKKSDASRKKKYRHQLKTEKKEKYEQALAKDRERKAADRVVADEVDSTDDEGFSQSCTFSRSVNRSRKSLPSKRKQKQEVVKKLFEESIAATPRKKKMHASLT